ncbi:unnamed protein product [Brassica rapa]|uniref:Formiminotransferase N-terminal subdomain domain-containing protein n=1 Tax=Brassica campestris TaxID=3711 RepID=A0A8D9HIX2_BRACM|nr:unnamed protein product [Brassica rapa]
MAIFCFLVDQRKQVQGRKPAAGLCSRCGGGAVVADMKTSTRFCGVPFYRKAWKAIVCPLCGAVLKSLVTLLSSTLAHEEGSSSSSPLKNAVFAMVKTALHTINLELHSGSHPRLGVVHHICFHPLSQTSSIDQVSAVATSLAMDIGSILRVPKYLYGAAQEEQCTLDSIRRKLGYFKTNREGHEWAGGLELEVVPMKPDAGPLEVSKAKRVVAVGACGWVSNYNVPVMSTDLKPVRRMARKVSERGGVLASVQTMALVHGAGVIEVACNLLNPSHVGGDDVQGLIEGLGREEDPIPEAQQQKLLLSNNRFKN